jgi:hypothetical protein
MELHQNEQHVDDSVLIKDVVEQINKNLISKSKVFELFNELVNNERVQNLVNIISGLDNDIFRQLFHRCDDQKVLHSIYAKLYTITSTKVELFLCFAALNGPSQQLALFLLEPFVDYDPVNNHAVNKAYFQNTCKFSNLLRCFTVEKGTSLCRDLLRRTMVNKHNPVVVYFHGLLLCHKDYSYSNDLVNSDLLIIAANILSTLTDTYEVPTVPLDYKSLCDDIGQNLYAQAFQAFRLVWVSACRSLYQFRISAQSAETSLLDGMMDIVQTQLEKDICRHSPMDLAQKLLSNCLEQRPVNFDAMDDLFAFYREICRKGVNPPEMDGKLLSLIMLCLENTKNNDFWLNASSLCEKLLIQRELYHEKLVECMIERIIQLNASDESEEPTIYTIMCALTKFAEPCLQHIIDSPNLCKVMNKCIEGANRVMGDDNEALRGYLTFICYLLQADLELFTTSFDGLTRLIVALLGKEGAIRMNILKITEKLSHNNAFCQQLAEKLGPAMLIYLPEQVVEKIMPIMEKMQNLPDEFLDPLTCNIMRNPVILPFDGLVVDRNTLMNLGPGESDGTKMHPYVRKEFSMDEVKDDDTMREKIEEWLK